jgi:hypothetical protein
LLQDPRLRVLLVGCCSQGSVAVWDVQLQQQIMAVHSPDLSLAALLPVQPPVGPMLAAAAAIGAAGGSKEGGGAVAKQQQQLLQQPLLLLALVASRDSTATPPAATAKAVSRIRSKATGVQLSLAAAAAATDGQQQQLELRPVLLQQPGLLIHGAPILAPSPTAAAAAGEGVHGGPLHHEQQQQQLTSPGISAAALSGTLAAAVGSSGFVHVWDVLSGQSLMSSQEAAALSACRSSSSSIAGVLAAVELVRVSSREQHDAGDADAAGSGCVVLLGSADGMLTCALV